MLAPLKRCTAAGPRAMDLPAAPEAAPPAKRRRERVVPSRFRDSALLPLAKKPCKPAPAPVDDDGEVYEVEVRAVAPKGEAFGAVHTEVWTGDDNQPPAQTDEELYRACRNIGRSSSPGCVSGSVVTSLSTAAVKCEIEDKPQVTSVSNAARNGTLDERSVVGSVVTSASNAGPEGKPAAAVVECKPKKECGARKEDFYWPEEFVLGDVVWARSGKKCPAWPALVIDPLLHAPEVVLNSCVPGALCVMFFGYSASGHSRDYGWVKQGMLFPFVEYLDRFQGQSLYKLRPSKFRAAIEEAFLAERGFFDLQMDGVCSLEKSVNEQSVADGTHEVTGSNTEQECQSEAVRKPAASCDSCGNRLPSKITKKKKQEAEQSLCRHCEKLLQSKQYCGICKKIWHHTDGGNWVCCDECEIWVHVECDRTCNELEDLENAEYFCPDCKSKRKKTLAVEQVSMSNSSEFASTSKEKLPESIPVCCAGMEALYLTEKHMILCPCKSCKKRLMTLNEWERHTGSRKKKWKTSIKLKSTGEPLINLLEDIPGGNFKSFAPGIKKEELLSLQANSYSPVYAKWTTERCAVCRWVEDWDYNKIIICNRCQIAVHQECYGARALEDLTNWVCRVCELPQQKRECCLCPVKGGALKPTDVDQLWVHVTCAWYQPKVSFPIDETMEPAMGVLSIPSEYFKKTCVICKQMHGACTQCYKCSTSYHAMCASRAGYRMELQYTERNGRQVTKMVSFCASHSAPDPDNVLIVKTPEGVFSTKFFIQNNEKQSPARLTSNENHQVPATFSDCPAARCLPYDMLRNKKGQGKAIPHRVMGPQHHSQDLIADLNACMDQKDDQHFSTFKDRLHYLQKTENKRVCYGRSGVHGWGLFAAKKIQEGQMVYHFRLLTFKI